MATRIALLLVLAISGVVAQGPQQRVFAEQGCIEKIPSAPKDLKASPKAKEINVAWNSPSGDACVDSYSYVVYKKSEARGARHAPGSAREYSLTIPNLEPDTEYVIEVTAVNQLKGASPPATITVRTLKGCNYLLKPGTVNPVFINPASATSVFLSWLPPGPPGICVDDYTVEGFEVATNKRVLASSGIHPRAKAVALVPGKQYKFLITPKSKRGAGDTTRVTFTMPNQYKVVASGSIPANGRRMLSA